MTKEKAESLVAALFRDGYACEAFLRASSGDWIVEVTGAGWPLTVAEQEQAERGEWRVEPARRMGNGDSRSTEHSDPEVDL